MRWLLAGLLGAALVASCGEGVVAPPSGSDTTLLILPRRVLLPVGDTLRLRGVVATEAGDTLDPPVGFAVRDPTVATVAADGLARGVSVGNTWIVADALGRRDSVFATVAAQVFLPDLQLLTNQLSNPLFLTQAPGDSDRLFVVEQGGRIRILRADTLVTRPFLDLTGIVQPPPLGEGGLLSMAFHPDYAQNRFFYVSYTDTQGDTRIVRYGASAADPDSADPTSASPVLSLDQPYPNHNGGLIVFGPDGMLYVGLGDGGSGGDPQNRAQNLDSLLGKLLRLDVTAPPYAAPPDNPFVGMANARGEIWAYGLRNPWRFSFDRATGHLYLGDVGQGALEEVNVQPAASAGGENYGWRIMEGSACFSPSANCSTAGLTLPVLDYPHANGACSVTGGYVYRGNALPILTGRYLYADYCVGWVRSFTYVNGGAVDRLDWTAQLSPGSFVTSFGEDNAGELYIILGAGSLYRIVPEDPAQVTK